jgi:hypothetical protein
LVFSDSEENKCLGCNEETVSIAEVASFFKHMDDDERIMNSGLKLTV